MGGRSCIFKINSHVEGEQVIRNVALINPRYGRSEGKGKKPREGLYFSLGKNLMWVRMALVHEAILGVGGGGFTGQL